MTKVNVWSLLLSQLISDLRAVGSRTSGFSDRRFSPLSNFEAFHARIKSLTVIVLTRRHVNVSSFSKRVRSCWRLTEIDVGSLLFGEPISKGWVISSRACRVRNRLITLLTNLESFHSRVESFTIVILARGYVDIACFSKRVRSSWRRPQINIRGPVFCSSVSNIRIIRAWTS